MRKSGNRGKEGRKEGSNRYIRRQRLSYWIKIQHIGILYSEKNTHKTKRFFKSWKESNQQRNKKHI